MSVLIETPKFDRRAVAEKGSYSFLWQLRSRGHSRRSRYIAQWPYPGLAYRCQNHSHANGQCTCASNSLVALSIDHYSRKRGIFVDLGCGDSADAAIARENGHYAFGMDLLPPSKWGCDCADFYENEYAAPFIKGDVCDRIPFDDGMVSYMTSHAVMDLMDAGSRDAFLAEVFRALKPREGLFAVSINTLAAGYGFTRAEENQRASRAGLKYWRSFRGSQIYYRL